MRFSLIYNASDACAAWAAERLEHVRGLGFGKCQAVGIMAGDATAQGADTARLWGVVVFHDWQPRARTCQVSVASESPLWAQPAALRELLAIPFEEWGVYKLWVAIPHTNERSLRFNRRKKATGHLRFGMTQEAILRHHFGKDTHAVILSMLRPEWERLWRRGNGQGIGAIAA